MLFGCPARAATASCSKVNGMPVDETAKTATATPLLPRQVRQLW